MVVVANVCSRKFSALVYHLVDEHSAPNSAWKSSSEAASRRRLILSPSVLGVRERSECISMGMDTRPFHSLLSGLLEYKIGEGNMSEEVCCCKDMILLPRLI